MSDDIVIRITGDSSGANESIQSVAAETDKLTAALSGAGTAGLVAGDEIAEGAQKAEFSMREARGTAALFGEEIGVRIPRHVASFVAELPGVGAAMSAAFSAVALIAIIELLVKGTEKLSDWIAKTFIFTDAQKALNEEMLKTNKSVADNADKVKALKEAYDNIGLTPLEKAQLAQQRLAEEIQKSKQDVLDWENALGTLNMGNDSATGLDRTAVEGKLTQARSTAALLAQEQDNSNKEIDRLQKDEDDRAAKKAEDAGKRRVEIENKVNLEILKARFDLNKNVEEDADATSKVMDERLKAELDGELKVGEAIQKANDAQLKLNESTAKAAAEAQADVVSRDKASGNKSKEIADTKTLIDLLEQERAAELAVIDSKMAEAQAAMEVAKSSGNNGGLNIADYNTALGQYREYEAQRVQIAAEANKKIQQTQNAELKAEGKDYQQYLTSFNSQFSSSIAQVVTQHETLGKSAEKMYSQMTSALIKNLATAALAELEGLALHRTIAAQKQLSDAKGAAGGAYNATVGIPYIGPVIAPIAAATAFAAVMAFDHGGINPQTQMALIHADEGVLTAPQVDTLRQAADNMGSSGGDTHIHNNTLHAMDSSSFQSYLKKNPGALSAGISHAAKNGHLNVGELARGK